MEVENLRYNKKLHKAFLPCGAFFIIYFRNMLNVCITSSY